MYLINKIFNNETIRTIWVKEEKNELVTNCHQLKLKAQDGKYCMTDVVDINVNYDLKTLKNKYKEYYMIKRIKKLDVIYNGDLLIDDVTEKKVKEVWNEFIKGKKACEFYDGDIYCVTKIDDFVPLIDVSKTKYSCLIYAKETNNLTIRSFFSAGYIKTIDNYICIILNNRDSLNAIGGIADSRDIINNKLDYYSCFIREFKEELGIDIHDNANFEMMLKYLKYPSGKELEDAFYPVGTIYEIKTKYTKEELINIFNNSEHENEVKELKFYNRDNYKDIFLCNKIDYLGELFGIIFEEGKDSE